MSTEQDDRSSHLEQQTTETTPLQEARATASVLPTITMAEVITHLALSPDASIVIASNGSIVLVNAAAATLFGYDPRELNGQPLEVLLPERFHTKHLAHRHAYVTIPLRRPMKERPSSFPSLSRQTSPRRAGHSASSLPRKNKGSCDLLVTIGGTVVTVE
jgi:PAS domain-containing protein